MDFPIVPIYEVPTKEKWAFQTIYRDSVFSDACLFWQVGFDTDKLVMAYGHEGGKTVTTTNDVTPKGKRTLLEQAHQEAKQRYIIKLREGYVSSEITDIPRSGALLATHYKPYKSNLSFPVATQAKLDGIRMLVSKEKEKGLYCMSRKGIRRLFFDHIKAELMKFAEYMEPTWVLDGELYTDEISFNRLCGICGKELVRDPEEYKIKYYIFDINTNDEKPFEDRIEILKKIFKMYLKDLHDQIEDDLLPDTEWDPTYGSKYLRMVNTYEVNNHDEILQMYEKYIEIGYEGIMIKKLGGNRTPKELKASMYRAGHRVNNIMKYKGVMEEEEATIIGAKQGTGIESGLVLWVVKDIRGNIITVRPMGTHTERRNLYANYDDYIGKPYTIKFQGLSEYGVPRFVSGKAIRDYE